MPGLSLSPFSPFTVQDNNSGHGTTCFQLGLSTSTSIIKSTGPQQTRHRSTSSKQPLIAATLPGDSRLCHVDNEAYLSQKPYEVCNLLNCLWVQTSAEWIFSKNDTQSRGHGGGAHFPQGGRDLWTHWRTSMSWWLNSLVKYGILNLRPQNSATAASSDIIFPPFSPTWQKQNKIYLQPITEKEGYAWQSGQKEIWVCLSEAQYSPNTMLQTANWDYLLAGWWFIDVKNATFHSPPLSFHCLTLSLEQVGPYVVIELVINSWRVTIIKGKQSILRTAPVSLSKSKAAALASFHLLSLLSHAFVSVWRSDLTYMC